MTVINDGQSQGDSDTADEPADDVLPGDEDQLDSDLQDVEDDQDDADDDQGDQQGGRRNREASLRRRAQAAEAERDQLRGQLDAMRADVINEVARAAHTDPRLLAAAGHDAAAFIQEDGTVDRAAVAAACKAAREEFGMGNGVRANLQQGTGGVGTGGKTGLAKTIGDALGRR